MKQLLQRVALMAMALCAPIAAHAQASDLFVSEYIEGSSNNKAIEIYNGTGGAVSLTAGAYVLQYHFNGSSTVGFTIALTGTVAAGDVYVVAQGLANATILAQADQTNSGSWFNGDDAVVLRKGGAAGPILDVVGQVGFDPGTEWGAGLTSTADNTIVRKPGICAGDSNGADAFDPATEWNGFANDTFGGLGSHTANCSSGPVLSINDVTRVEGNSGISTFTFTVSLASPAPVGGVSFNFATASDSATSGVDFAATSGSRTIAAGASSTTLTVDAYGDTDLEIDETFLVNLSNPSPGANIGDGSGLGTIDNDDIIITSIGVIQGIGELSTYDNLLAMTEGVVTAKRGNGFFLQSFGSAGAAADGGRLFVFERMDLAKAFD